MRVLFCSTGPAGHARPMFALARAFMDRGHGLAWCAASDSGFAPALPGLERFCVGLAIQEARGIYRRRWPEAATLRGEALAEHTFPRLFGGVMAPAMLEDLDALLPRWRPDLVVYEVAALAAPVACARHGIRCVMHGYGLAPSRHKLQTALREFAAGAGARRLTPHDDAVFQSPYLDIAPASLQTADADWRDKVQPLSPAAPTLPVTHALSPALRARLAASPRKKAYVSFGTVFNQTPIFRRVLSEIAALGLEVVATLGPDGDARSMDGLPPRVHTTLFIEQTEILPLCDLVISHAGAGTMLGAALFGKPQLLLPQAADQFANARALVSAGVGKMMADVQENWRDIAPLSQSLLNCAHTAGQASKLAAEIREMPSAAHVASLLEGP